MAIKSDYISGTLTITQGSTAFTGTGTGWRSAEFKEGDTLIDITGATEYMGVIEEITGEATGTLTKPWEGPTLTNVPYRMRYQPDGARSTAQARNLIEILGNGNITAFALLNGAANLLPMFTGPGAMTLITRQALVSGAAYDVQVATLADRAAYDGQDQGYAVLVSNVGDGRAAIYSKNSATSGDWSDPAYITGAVGPVVQIVAGVTTNLPSGQNATLVVRPINDGYALDFGIPRGLTGADGEVGATGPRGEGLQIGATGDLAGRAAYDNEEEGFSYVDVENGNLYFRMGAPGGWSDPIPFGKGDKGDPGDDGATIVTTNGVGNGTAGPYTLTEAPASVSATWASISGVTQYDFTLSGNQITFGIPVETGIAWQVKSSGVLSIITPADGSVGASKINSAEAAGIRTAINVAAKPATATVGNIAVFDENREVVDGEKTIEEVIAEAVLESNGKSTIIPQGRLTLTSGQPVQISNATAASVIYYTPFVGDRVSIWDGVSNFTNYEFSELILSLAAAYHPADKQYDLYVVRDGGVIYLATGPAWAGDNLRGTGVGSAEIETIKGIKVNKNSITVRPGNTSSGTTIALAARAGTLVGWIRTSAAGQTEYTIMPNAAAGGTNNKLFIGNAYNKRVVVATERDSTASWTYASTITRAANASNNNRISFIMGEPDAPVEAKYSCLVGISTAGGYPLISIGLDSTTTNASIQAGYRAQSVPENSTLTVDLWATPGIGLHYVQAQEGSLTGTSAAYLGDVNFYRLTAAILM